MQKNYNTACIAQRNQLFKNGFIILPLDGKRPTYKGWTAPDLVTQKWLDSFKRKTKYGNTGIRCDNVIAFDIDILDDALADQAEALIEAQCGPTNLCRYGKAPKRLLLYRADGDVAKSARTGKYGGHMVEKLATRGRQFVACGIHPDTGKPYIWADNISPMTTPWADLPALDNDTADATMDAVEALLAASGYTLETAPRRLGVEHPDIYDLSDDTDCQLDDGTEIKWSALRDTLNETGVMGNLRRENGDFGDSNGVHFYLSDIDGAPVAYDFARDTFHREAPATQKLAAALPPTTQKVGPDYLADMLDQWVLMGDDTARLIDHPFRPYKLGALNKMFAHQRILQPMKRGPAKPVPVVQVWQQHPNTKRAHYAAMRPDYPDDIFVQEGRQTVFNTYRRPIWPDSGGEVSTFYEFIDHLIPDNTEYHIFMGWLANKVQHPGERQHGLLMVTPAYGTGRGTLAKIIGRLLGPEYLRQIELHDLIGTGGQSSFNDHMAESLMVYVPEALENIDTTQKYAQRRSAYEKLKQSIDPIASKIRVNRKYGANTMEHTFATFLISTNHVDALALDPNDRRLIVLDNSRTPLAQAPDNLMDRIHAWADKPANIGALARELAVYAQHESTYNPYDNAPMTEAKARMIDAGQSDLDRLYQDFADEAPGDLCTHTQFTRYVIERARSDDLNIPDATTQGLDKAIASVLQTRSMQIMGRNRAAQFRCGKARIRVWILRDAERWQGGTDGVTVCSEVSKNGAVSLTEVKQLLPQKARNGDK